jgi:uncharacterized phage protein (TIGR02216 family)
MGAARERFPWQRLMVLGLHEKQMAPEIFWRATLREIVPVRVGSVAGLRDNFEDMMRQWPDVSITGE